MGTGQHERADMRGVHERNLALTTHGYNREEPTRVGNCQRQVANPTRP